MSMSKQGWHDVTRQNKVCDTLLSAQAPLSSQARSRLLPTAFTHVRARQWLHMFNQQNHQLTTSTTGGTTPATEVIFSLATAMTHFLPLLPWLAPRRSDWLLAQSSLSDSGSNFLRTQLAPEQLLLLSCCWRRWWSDQHACQDARVQLEQVGFLGRNQEHFHSRVRIWQTA